MRRVGRPSARSFRATDPLACAGSCAECACCRLQRIDCGLAKIRLGLSFTDRELTAKSVKDCKACAGRPPRHLQRPQPSVCTCELSAAFDRCAVRQ